MRKTIWIPCIVVLAVCLLLLFKTKQNQKVALPEPSGALTNHPAQLELPKAAENRSAQNPSRNPTARRAAVEPTTTMIGTNAIDSRVLADWQAPINFFGKIIDGNTNPVAGAQITFHWVEYPAQDGNRTTNTYSDTDGLFSLQNAVGLSLSVSVSKEGYYPSRRDNDSFSYGFLAGGHFLPDSKNPVIFHLRKKSRGSELITSENGMQLKVDVRIPKDNIPVRVDLLQKQASATGQLEISQIKPPFRGATNWSFRMSIPDGGLVENQEEFQFAAPESDYQPTVEFHFTKGETNWTTQVTKQFYIAFGQPRQYGWLRIESNLAQETIFLTYAINPTGSRNLEPAN